MLLKLKMVGSNFFCGRKIIQIWLSHSPLYGDVQLIFSRFYWYSKWPPQMNFKLFVWKVKKSLVIFLEFPHHIPSNGDVQVFLGCYQNSKLARGQLQIFLLAQKLFSNFSNLTITFCTIWRCAGDFFKVLLKFKLAATDQLFCGRKNSEN